LIPQIESLEAAEPFWKPIIDLDPEALDWVESFFRYWFLHGKRAAESPEAFAAHWRSMIEYALVPRQLESGRSPHRRGSLFPGLMGLDWAGIDAVGGEEFRGALGSMAPLYREWASRSMGCFDAASRLARLLRKPAAAGMLAEGLGWLSESVQGLGDRDWDGQSKAVEALVSLVEHWWRTRRGADRAPADGQEAAMTLLKILADRQHPRALELQDQIARG